MDREGNRLGPSCLTNALADLGWHPICLAASLSQRRYGIPESNGTISPPCGPNRVRVCSPSTLNSSASSTDHPMSAPSPARRGRSRFMGIGLWTSALAFLVIEGYVLQDQLAIGHASGMFMFGSACLVAAVCIGLFAIIMAMGLAVSAAFSDEPTPHQSHHIQDSAADSGAPVGRPPPPGVSPALGRSSSRRPRQRRRIRTVAGEARKTSTRSL